MRGEALSVNAPRSVSINVDSWDVLRNVQGWSAQGWRIDQSHASNQSVSQPTHLLRHKLIILSRGCRLFSVLPLLRRRLGQHAPGPSVDGEWRI